MGRCGAYITAAVEGCGACVVCVCVCARSLRAVVCLDLCPFGGRKFACGGVGGVGQISMGKEVEGRSEGRVGGENESERKNKVRNEEARAAGRFKPYLKIWEVTFTSDVALPVTSVKERSRYFMPTGRSHCVRSPVTFVPERFRYFMPTGRSHCVRSPARKKTARRGRRKEERGEKEKVRNEGEASAESPKNVINMTLAHS